MKNKSKYLNLEVKNCNNIKECKLKLKLNEINLLYGKNGQGKSSMALSLYDYSLKKDVSCYQTLNSAWGDLYINIPKNLNISLYNKNFVNDIVFSNNKFYENSRELYFKSPEYIEEMKKFDVSTSKIRNVIENKDLMSLFNSVEELASIKLKGNNRYYSTLKKENPFLSTIIPKRLRKVRDNNKTDLVGWGRWWHDGSDKFIFDNLCPFCGTDFSKSFLINYEKLKDILDKNTFDLRSNINENIKIIEKYTAIDCLKVKLLLNSRKKIESKANKKSFIVFLNKINKLKTEFEKIKNIPNCSEEFDEKSKININVIGIVKDLDFVNACEEYNNYLGLINKHIRIMRHYMNSILKRNIELANLFCQKSGMNYKFRNNNGQMLLVFEPENKDIENLDNHLSYGERNTISLLIFLLINQKNKDSLIIFDDPISSYDDTKKISLYDLLFFNKKMKIVKNNTVLFLTHDIDVLIELMNIKEREWSGDSKLLINNEGVISLKEIKKSDLKCLYENLMSILMSSNCIMVKLIYFRKLIECNFIKDISLKGYLKGTFNGRGLIYNYISGIFKNQNPKISRNGREMNGNELAVVYDNIKRYLPEFSTELLEEEKKNMIKYYYNSNTLCKIVLIRYIIFKYYGEDDTTYPQLYNDIKAFINDRYHIEMLRMMDLDLEGYDLFPNYILKIMDEIVDITKNNFL